MKVVTPVTHAKLGLGLGFWSSAVERLNDRSEGASLRAGLGLGFWSSAVERLNDRSEGASLRAGLGLVWLCCGGAGESTRNSKGLN